jgi:rubrerythrin
MAELNFTPRQILNRAIGKEEQAKMMYEIYAGKVEDPNGKKLLKELAQEESRHKETLEKIDPEKPGTFKARKVSSAEFSDFSNRPQITKESTMQEVLKYAIAEESDAIDFYSSIAEFATDKKLVNLRTDSPPKKEGTSRNWSACTTRCFSRRIEAGMTSWSRGK